MSKTIRTLIFLLLLSIVPAIAQTPKEGNTFINFNYQRSNILATDNFLKGENKDSNPIKNGDTFFFEYGKRSHGNRLWQQLMNYPSYGIGISNSFFRNREIGNPFSFYGFFYSKIKEWSNISFNYKLNLGLAWFPEPYNFETNPYNMLTGSHLNLFFGVELFFDYELTKITSLKGGIGFIHSSNGKLQEPNDGINYFGPNFGLKFRLYKNQKEFISQEVPETQHIEEILIWGSGGIQQAEGNDEIHSNQQTGAYYGVGVLGIAWQKRVSYQSSIGGGLDFSYLGYAKPEDGRSPSELSFKEKLLISTFFSYELRVDKFDFYVQPGFYVYKDDNAFTKPFMYERIGLRYNFLDNLFGAISLRAYDFTVADFIELSIGTRFSLK